MKVALKSTSVKQQDIYGLITGMNRLEHNFYCNSVSGSDATLHNLQDQLYWAIWKKKACSDHEAKQILGIKNAAQFSTLKRKLSTEVLEALAFCRRATTAKIQHHFGIMKLEVLLEERNFTMARSVYKVHFAKVLALGAYAWCLQLLRLRKRLHQLELNLKDRQDVENTDADIELFTEYAITDQALEKYAITLQHIRAQRALLMLPKQKAEAEKIHKAIQILDAQSKKTAHLRLRYLNVATDLAYLIQDFDDCHHMLEEAIMLASDDSLAMVNPDAILTLANTSFYNAFAKEDTELAQQRLDFWGTKAKYYVAYPFFNAVWKVIAFNTALKIAHKKTDYSRVATLLQQQNDIIKTAKEWIPIERSMTILASISISHFVLADYNAAEHVLLDIIELNRKIQREDILYFTLIFQLLIYFEQRAWYRLDTATEAAYHFLYSRKKMRIFEKELMSFFNQLTGHRAKGTLQTFIANFLMKLEQFKNDPVQRLYFLYFNYYDWLQSKLHGMDYRQYREQLTRQTPHQ